ncbi:MAG TPA: hypothetical protein VEQ11_00085 [Chloroflexota bacterium]|nr:hypothetical protein [Chloroflexota bacterium]
MQRVLLTGWERGLRKVSLARLLQERAGLSLATAKGLVDRCLAGEIMTVELASIEDAEALVREAGRLGATAELDRVARRPS